MRPHLHDHDGLDRIGLEGRGDESLRFKGGLLNAGYASDLSEVIESGRPALWVHGHTHDSCDYQVGSTRVVCNPRGYEDENSAFDPALVVAL